MKLKELTSFLESFAPLAFQEDYDNSGLLAGLPEQDITAALVCLDITPATVDEALSRGCNLIISHHPFIFHGLKKVEPGKPESDILVKVIKHDIAVYAIHTNIDNSIAGLNEFLCGKLGLTTVKILSERGGMLSKLVTFTPHGYTDKVRQAMFNAGAGVIGKYDLCSYNVEGQGTFRASAGTNPFVGEKNVPHVEKETRIEVVFPNYIKGKLVNALLSAHPYEEVAFDIYPLSNSFPSCGSGMLGKLTKPMKPEDFLEMLKKKLKITLVRHTELPDKKIGKVAICSGSGSFLIPDALKAGADVFLTSDLKYHDFFNASQRILLADIGHYESEQWIKDLLTERLIEKFPTFAVLSSGLHTNPVHYL
ncbi:MAG: Nif3-like dinuclear metal center hexameric protein [Bacteroidales bacterium]